jgi:hypothetical protein
MASPTVLIVGGPNGAGKTTLAEPYAEQKDRPYLAADRIASELNPEDPYAARIEAGRQCLRRLNAFIEERTSFVVESTLAGRSLARSIDRMNEAGYITRIAFVVLDSADLCAPRAGAGAEGGAPRSGRRRSTPVHSEQEELLDVVSPEGGSMASPPERRRRIRGRGDRNADRYLCAR